ncbi:MAG TPA: DUF1801 domain-containing protein [Rhizobiaceae bacterium]|nr:DUF1801 domain-containing protein [Rhizobiaceae bacterium]
MVDGKSPIQTIDAYIEAQPGSVRDKLRALREAIRAEAPHAEEKIGYGIPTFVLGENLVHFASFTHHIGFYPGPSGIAAFKEELAGYKGAKGSVQFPLEGPLPLDLVARITRFRVQEAVARTEAKRRRA